jgi:hypothetical protein
MIIPFIWTVDPLPKRVKLQILMISKLFSQNTFYPIDFVIGKFEKFLPSCFDDCSSLFLFFMSSMAIEINNNNIKQMKTEYKVAYYIFLIRIMYSTSQKQNSQLKFYELFKEFEDKLIQCWSWTTSKICHHH